ncbi:DUF480 domain-containing protein [Cocleimonas flava]|uniref:Uncharacterized protein n=1 Tax=Cocleimonas flava TaxID=634765 RepID=A0A4R1F1K8_9GAMM|nr:MULTISPECIES: YceH family protein [Cocleimonas]MEB8433037.1 YceH family protein [Cocleimonas sp. KMM 6892]MEC4715982.1 YceH family protein [Cocleimonas sp. KMM 6895]MEC4745443.1 YceH family protein [Cocleimonas sp. KMM 6896]TCJ87783.1 hypothetical protein EV695_2298 [Cocleimonas flava]
MDETLENTDSNSDDLLDETQDEVSQEPAYFTALEARVIGSLMEKHLTTPNNYPLTINSLSNACNQKSNREPVMNLTEGQVGHTVNALVERKLAGIDYGERSNKISHRVCTELDIDRKQQAILTVLLLRKPQTLNDLKTRTARMVDFESNDEIHDNLIAMIEREMPLVTLIPKGAGRREDRFAHTLCGEVSVEDIEKDAVSISSIPLDNDRLDAIEARLAAIEAKLGIN